MGPMSSERTPLLAAGARTTAGSRKVDDIEAAALESSAPGLAAETDNADQALELTEEVDIKAGSHETPSDYIGDYSKARFWTIFLGILFGYFVALFDSTLMASAHPVITSYFEASNSASWLSTAFMLTSTALQPLFGRLSDTFGRRPVYLFSLAVFAGTTTWCGLADSIGSFIAARAVSGLGAGGVQSLGSIIVNDLVRIEVRGTYQAYLNLFFGLGGACGAAFGGWLCDTLGWRWTFGIQIPPIIIIWMIAFFALPKNLGPQLASRKDTKWYSSLREIDILGSILLTMSTSLLILGLNLGGNILPWNDPRIIAALIAGVVALVLLGFAEKRAKRPVMPLQMLFSRPRGNLVFSNFFSQMGINTVIFNAPLYFQAVKQDSPSVSGFRLGLPSAMLTLFAVSTGIFITRTGRMKSPQVVGAISMLIGAVCLTAIWEEIPSWLAMIYVAFPSSGQGFMFPATTVSTLAVSTQADQAVMTTTLGLWRNLGTVFGVAISSLILQNSLIGYLEEYITGHNKTKVIAKVRSSVRAIGTLHPTQKDEAIKAYAEALRVTFGSAIAIFIVVNVLIWPVQLPRLGRDKVMASNQTEEGDPE